MRTLVDYLSYPNEEEWVSIVKASPFLQDLRLEIRGEFGWAIGGGNSLLDPELGTQLRHFSNRLGQLQFTYILLTHCFNKEVPDDRWHAVVDGGESVRYFPDFEERHFFNKFLFDYYTDVFYRQFFSAFDFIYHIVNLLFSLGIKRDPKRRFSDEVMERLKKTNPVLRDCINRLKGNAGIGRARRLRHSFTHDFAPTELTSGITKSTHGRSTTTYLGIGKYTTSKQFMENVRQSLAALGRGLKEIGAILNESEGIPRISNPTPEKDKG